MSRPLRVEYPGVLYHVMSRGDRREAIFHDDRDRHAFLGKRGRQAFFYPQVPRPSSTPIWMSRSRLRPRHITVKPGGGSLVRAK